MGPNKFFLDGTKEWIQWALRHGAKMAEHPFEQVFLWTSHAGIQPVSIKRNEIQTHSELGIAFSMGYPTLCVNRFTVPFVTAAAMSAFPLRTSFIAKTTKRVVVRPRDAEYARHAPAERRVQYSCEVIAWETKAELQTTVSFADDGETIALAPRHIEGLSPNTAYWGHNLHEFEAPRSLKTWHVVQLR